MLGVYNMPWSHLDWLATFSNLSSGTVTKHHPSGFPTVSASCCPILFQLPVWNHLLLHTAVREPIDPLFSAPSWLYLSEEVPCSISVIAPAEHRAPSLKAEISQLPDNEMSINLWGLFTWAEVSPKNHIAPTRETLTPWRTRIQPIAKRMTLLPSVPKLTPRPARTLSTLHIHWSPKREAHTGTSLLGPTYESPNSALVWMLNVLQ